MAYSVVFFGELIQTVRGKEFSLQAVVVGQSLGVIPSGVRISLQNGVQVSADQQIQFTGKTCTNVSYRLFAERDYASVRLFPDTGPCRDNRIGTIVINVNFLPCPNGFVQNGSECVCDKQLQRFNAICNVSDNLIKWTSTVLWMGVDYDDNNYRGLVLYPECPFDFCIDRPVPITLENLDV